MLTELAPVSREGDRLLLEALALRGNLTKALRAYKRLRVLLANSRYHCVTQPRDAMSGAVEARHVDIRPVEVGVRVVGVACSWSNANSGNGSGTTHRSFDGGCRRADHCRATETAKESRDAHQHSPPGSGAAG